MPKVAKEMSAPAVKGLSGRARKVAVGGVSGLYLQILPTGGRTWILRTRVAGKTRDIGLGGFPDVTLGMARDRARDAKDKIRDGIDPVEERKAKRSALIAARRRGLTFAEAVKGYDEAKLAGEANRERWLSSVERYATPQIGEILVQDVTPQDILRVLQPIWTTKAETARKLRSRLEAILSWATVAGHRSGDNPARWGGNLKELLPKQSGQVINQPALSLADVASWFADLRKREGMGSRALEFLALTAVRSGDVRGATWDEIDLANALWTIPAARMKMGKEHRVPLSAPTVELLMALPRFKGNPLVFPAARGGMLSDMTLSATMKRLQEAEVKERRKGWLDSRSGLPAVPHGLRSTFKDWATERTEYPNEMSEIALAHSVGSKVEQAYRRSDMMEKRRAMMADWAQFLEGSEVVVW